MNEIRVWIIGEIILNGKTVVLREKQDPTPFFFCRWFSDTSNGSPINTCIIS